MFHRAALAGVCLTALLAVPASAQVTLRWKFPTEGDIYYLEEKIASKTTVTIQGEKTTDEQTQYRLSRLLVKSTSKDNIVLEQRIEAWQSRVSGAGVDQEDTELLEKVCKNLNFRIELGSTGKINSFTGYEQFLKNLAKIDPAEHKKFKSVAPDDDVFRGPLKQIFEILPIEAVKRGQSWKRDSTVQLGSLGTFKLATTFTLADSPKKGSEKIDTKAILSFEPPGAGAGDAGVKILKLDLSRKEATGHIVFNNTKGQLVELERSTPLAGKMVVESQGKRVELELDGSETRSVRFLETRPKPPKTGKTR